MVVQELLYLTAHRIHNWRILNNVLDCQDVSTEPAIAPRSRCFGYAKTQDPPFWDTRFQYPRWKPRVS